MDKLSTLFSPQLIINILNIFQENLDQFVIPTISYDDFALLLTADEKQELHKVIYQLRPQQSGLKKYPFNIKESDLMCPTNTARGQEKFVRVTLTVQQNFDKMASHLLEDTGLRLKILSGYRSPTYQALLLCGQLYRDGFDMLKTLRAILPPGYSGHQDPLLPAIDIGHDNLDLQNREFMTLTYPWLKKYAYKYGFVESYPKTQVDMIWEPWHWKMQ